MLKQLALLLAIGASTISALVARDGPGNYFYGLNYGINPEACPSYEQLKSDFAKIKEYTNTVRTFSMGTCDEGQLALQAANELGMDIYLGMWIDSAATFDAELAALDKLVHNNQNFERVKAVIAGSEVLYRKNTDADTLAAYIHKVGLLARPKGIKVTTADVYYEFPPVVVAELDFLMMNAFPYWEGVTAPQGGTTLIDHFNSVVEGRALGKPVRISETGWPSDGGNFGASVASPENEKLYLSNVLCLTRQKGIDMIYFSAFDEPYKAGVESHWGIMHPNGTLKAPLSLQLLQNPSC
ncbi:glycoside hydrolase superfamily [Helicostylum pulchrum]|nr:glycoside hydrolase superfamily [Helicostylum pulchrum]